MLDWFKRVSGATPVCNSSKKTHRYFKSKVLLHQIYDITRQNECNHRFHLCQCLGDKKFLLSSSSLFVSLNHRRGIEQLCLLLLSVTGNVEIAHWKITSIFVPKANWTFHHHSRWDIGTFAVSTRSFYFSLNFGVSLPNLALLSVSASCSLESLSLSDSCRSLFVSDAVSSAPLSDESPSLASLSDSPLSL